MALSIIILGIIIIVCGIITTIQEHKNIFDSFMLLSGIVVFVLGICFQILPTPDFMLTDEERIEKVQAHTDSIINARKLMKYADIDMSIDSVNITVNVTIKDGIVTRKADLTLRGKDFNNAEIETTNKAFNKVIIEMLNQRKEEIKKARVEKNKQLYAGRCKEYVVDNNKFWLCPNE